MLAAIWDAHVKDITYHEWLQWNRIQNMTIHCVKFESAYDDLQGACEDEMSWKARTRTWWLKLWYSETCGETPPWMPPKIGLSTEVVSHWKYTWLYQTEQLLWEGGLPSQVGLLSEGLSSQVSLYMYLTKCDLHEDLTRTLALWNPYANHTVGYNLYFSWAWCLNMLSHSRVFLL